MYTDLGTLFSELRKAASLVLIAGDFNAKVGNVPGVKYALEDTQEGRETTVVKYLLIHNLFICNSVFQHPARHITTWEFSREVNKKIIHIYNQIDYIICLGNRKHVLIDARSYSGTQVNSDHRIVICKLRTEPFKLFRNIQKNIFQLPDNDQRCNYSK